MGELTWLDRLYWWMLDKLGMTVTEPLVLTPVYSPPDHARCDGSGCIRCRCGGDQCYCDNQGEVVCYGCENCERDEDEYDDMPDTTGYGSYGH